MCVDAVYGLGRGGRGLDLGGLTSSVGVIQGVMGGWHCRIRLCLSRLVNSAKVLLVWVNSWAMLGNVFGVGIVCLLSSRCLRLCFKK